MDQNTKLSNPKDREATARLDLTTFPQTAIIYGALAMVEGGNKYGEFNFRSIGVNASVYVAACMRHIFKWYNGENEDEKTKVPHLGSALACLAILVDAEEMGNLKDDRPPVCDVATLLAEFEEKVKHLQQLFPNGPDRYTEEGERQKFLKKEDH